MEAESLKEKLTENLGPIPPVGLWVNTEVLQPKPGMRVVKYYPIGSHLPPCRGYWAGEHVEKSSMNFTKWMRLE